MKALFFGRFGDADVLSYGDLPAPALDAQSVLVAPTFVGLNFADIYRRQGNYVLQGEAPWIGGYEGVGHVVAISADVCG
ncbi:alcohol dehydrogenase catalytic domain-containing protein [Komagataeibacter saccharivorans]|uniref:alcohol dehydrogenase catalytic domain-containing protein n=1 Tax=Komagataeibacter saccharivorans TaxID=265959 RepID=UPI0039E83C09